MYRRNTRDARLSAVVCAALVGCGLFLAGCSDDSGSAPAATETPTITASPTGTNAPVATATPTDLPTSGEVVFSPEGNNLWAYETAPPFNSQKVNAANHTFDGSPGDPSGWDINGQICHFHLDGKEYLISGEDTHQPDPPAGWGIFELTGDSVGEFAVHRVARLVPTYQPTPDGPDNYGCGVLSDGRVLTTDIGNDAGGPANGQLIVWFPPFTGDQVSYCKIDLQLATGQGIYVEDDDTVYLNSPRPAAEPNATAAGIFRYLGPFPTSDDAAGGCGRTDNLGSPLADSLTKERVLDIGLHGLISPSGIARGPNGHFFVASVITGVINEYDANWQFVQTVLQPPVGEVLGAQPYSTGTPLGITVAPDGTLYYADIGIVINGADIGPGNHTGSLRRITFTEGAPNPPETIAGDLQFPDGLGLWPP